MNAILRLDSKIHKLFGAFARSAAQVRGIDQFGLARLCAVFMGLIYGISCASEGAGVFVEATALAGVLWACAWGAERKQKVGDTGGDVSNTNFAYFRVIFLVLLIVSVPMVIVGEVPGVLSAIGWGFPAYMAVSLCYAYFITSEENNQSTRGRHPSLS